MTGIETGLYEHFQGRIYRVIGTATHSDTHKRMVVFYAFGHQESLFYLPVSSFLQMVNKAGMKGEQVPRFKFVHSLPY